MTAGELLSMFYLHHKRTERALKACGWEFLDLHRSQHITSLYFRRHTSVGVSLVCFLFSRDNPYTFFMSCGFVDPRPYFDNESDAIREFISKPA